ncbi:Protease inhibitor precursor [compost metagenome]
MRLLQLLQAYVSIHEVKRLGIISRNLKPQQLRRKIEMKKIAKVLLAMTITAATLVPTMVGAAAVQPVKVTVDGNTVNFPDAKPVLESSRVLIPVRFVSEALGAKVGYKDRTVTVEQNSKVISLKVDSKNVSVAGKNVVLDVPARIQESRTYVPLRFVSEALGATVQYADQTVTITTATGGSVTVPDGVFKVDPQYHDLAPLLFKDNMRIEGDELVFTMPDLKGRTKGLFKQSGQSDIVFTAGQEYRFKLGQSGYVGISYAHSDDHPEIYFIYLDPANKVLEGNFDSIKGDVVVVSANTTIPDSEATLSQVIQSYN